MEMFQYEADKAVALFVVIMTAIPIVILVVAKWLVGGPYDRKSGRLRVTTANAPVIMAAISNHGELALLDDGYTSDERRYSYVMGLGLIYSSRPLYGLYTVELPFVSSAHIVSLSHNDSFPVKLQVGKDSALEEMVLEGDYPNYFTVYVDNGQQSEGRYVLDPKAMLYTVDFCKQYNWEIVGDTLFFLSSTELPTHDLVDAFIKEIQPAVQTGEKPHRHSHDLPYVTKQPLRLDCPVCHGRMKPGREWLACPNNHGILLTGKQMTRLRVQADIKHLRQALFGKEERDRQLSCPHCHAPMQQSRFLNTDRYVDICTMCRFRWLDYNEVTEIAGLERALL